MRYLALYIVVLFLVGCGGTENRELAEMKKKEDDENKKNLENYRKEEKAKAEKDRIECEAAKKEKIKRDAEDREKKAKDDAEAKLYADSAELKKSIEAQEKRERDWRKQKDDEEHDRKKQELARLDAEIAGKKNMLSGMNSSSHLKATTSVITSSYCSLKDAEKRLFQFLQLQRALDVADLRARGCSYEYVLARQQRLADYNEAVRNTNSRFGTRFWELSWF